MFEGFEEFDVAGAGTSIHGRLSGNGPPLLLLHGFPETHVMWHRVASALAEQFSVVAADLRGYGGSGIPPSNQDHAPYAKRVMAADMVVVMQRLGHERFSVVGHDRGGRVAYRMALDHTDRIDRLALLDVVPTAEALDRADARLALAYWPWSLLTQPEPFPERLIASAPDAFVDAALTGWGSHPASFPHEVRAAYVEALKDPASAHAVCEEYRAAVNLDYEADRHDLAAKRRIGAPTLVLWAASGPLDSWYEHTGGPLGIWRSWATDVTGEAVPGGHFFPEENPDATLGALSAFLWAGHRAGVHML